MTLSAAERQARRREKLKTDGKVFFQAWVTPTQAKRIKALLDVAVVTYHGPPGGHSQAGPAPPRRKRPEKLKAKPFVPLAELKGLSKETMAFLERKEIKALVKRIDKPGQ